MLVAAARQENHHIFDLLMLYWKAASVCVQGVFPSFNESEMPPCQENCKYLCCISHFHIALRKFPSDSKGF